MLRSVVVIFIVNLWSSLALSKIDLSYYHQMVHLGDSSNNIHQAIFRGIFKKDNYRIYGGFYFDDDTLSNKKRTFTDKQISPLIGIESNIFFKSRFYVEGRDVNRFGDFPDGRPSQDEELRWGAFGYNYSMYGSSFFTEWYYNTFYSRLYGDKFIAQFWHKQGFEIGKLSIFNELLFDSFDLTSNESSVVDFRPGIRYRVSPSPLYSFQVLIQHAFPIGDDDREDETRGNLILFIYY